MRMNSGFRATGNFSRAVLVSRPALRTQLRHEITFEEIAEPLTSLARQDRLFPLRTPLHGCRSHEASRQPHPHAQTGVQGLIVR